MQNDDAEVLERLLKQAGPILAGINAPERKLSPDELEEIMEMLAKTVPPLHELTDEEMKIEILKLLPQGKPMNGVQIVAALREFRRALKDAGTGAIYGLLWDLEESGLLAGPKEPSESGIREYSIRPKGREKLQSPEAPSSGLSTMPLRPKQST